MLFLSFIIVLFIAVVGMLLYANWPKMPMDKHSCGCGRPQCDACSAPPKKPVCNQCGMP